MSITLVICSILLGLYIFYNPIFTSNVINGQAAVNSIEIEDPLRTGNQVTVVLRGELPTPCWEIDRHELRITISLKYIHITLWAFTLISVICIQMISHFRYEFKLVFPLSGNWTIECNYDSLNVTVYD